MKIEFKMSYKLGLLEFKVGDQLEISKNTIFESINDKYYMLILKGLRYDNFIICAIINITNKHLIFNNYYL